MIGIEASAFRDHTGLRSIVIPDTITNIGTDAFYNCNNLNSVTIPSSVTNIGMNAFFLCRSLTSVTLTDGLTNIGSSAFAGCTNLMNIAIPNSVTSIGLGAFNATGIYNSFANNSVVYADKWVVGHKGTVTNINLRSDTVGICENAFSNCNSLTNITIPKSVKYICFAAFYYSSIQNVTFDAGNELKTINNTTFYNCSNLKNITLPDSLTEIGNYAFYNCSSLKSIVIPNSVTNIDIQAFDGCNKLTIYAEALTAQSGWFEHESRSWNCSNRPVVWGCTLSASKTYVVSFTKTENCILNPAAADGISEPYREGHTFGGWNTVSDGSGTVYSLTNNTQYTAIPNGTTLYAIWN